MGEEEAPEGESEITAEMIAAGVRVACLYDMRQDDWAEVVREVYAEMRCLERGFKPLGLISGPNLIR